LRERVATRQRHVADQKMRLGAWWAEHEEVIVYRAEAGKTDSPRGSGTRRRVILTCHQVIEPRSN
jgi:hypothetical protein